MKKITFLIVLLFTLQQATAQSSCGTAQPVAGEGFYAVGVINGDLPSPICASNGAGATKGAWFSYTPTADHTVTINTSISLNNPLVDTRVHVYTGPCGSLVCHAGDDDSGASYSSICVFNVAANTTYLIAFDNRWTSNAFTFQLTEGDLVPEPVSPISFTSQTLSTINNTGDYNICAVDLNNDFLDDLVGVDDSNIHVNYQNADGTFTVADIPTETAGHLPSWSISAGDFNADGYNDLLYGSGNGVTLMKSNDTGTSYSQYTPGEYIFCQRTNFIDINNDGNLDAFSCHDVAPNCYYINDGNANFTFYQSSITPGSINFGSIGGNYATLWFDYDNDGDQDVFISKCSGPPCELHRNDGGGIFTDISAEANLDMTPIQSWSSAVADFDNDGDMDILIGSNGNAGFRLMRNDLDTTNSGEEAFTDVTPGSGFDINSMNRDYIAYDFDNDGFVDVMGGGNKIMFNNGNMTFSQITLPGVSIGPVGDFNNDGFLDIQNGNTLKMNSGNPNKWLTVNLHGTESNINGIGARVEIYGPFGKQIRDVRSGEGFEYMSTLNIHFGIGSASAIDKLVVIWPSGTTDTILNPSSNQVLTVTEGSSPLATQAFSNNAFSIYPNPTNGSLNIKSANLFTSASVSDLTGRTIITRTVTNSIVDVKSLSAGTYILILKDKQGNQFSQKFLKN